MTLEEAEQRPEWPLGARWQGEPILERTYNDGTVERVGRYLDGLGVEINGEIWLPADARSVGKFP